MSSNRLAILAAEIREADRRFRRSAEETAAAALDAGKALIEAKALLRHGGWLFWLAQHCAMSARTATRVRWSWSEWRGATFGATFMSGHRQIRSSSICWAWSAIVRNAANGLIAGL